MSGLHPLEFEEAVADLLQVKPGEESMEKFAQGDKVHISAVAVLLPGERGALDKDGVVAKPPTLIKRQQKTSEGRRTQHDHWEGYCYDIEVDGIEGLVPVMESDLKSASS